ncbi:lytic murein transglycosylase [Primorskyibacter sp. S87]|uniref:lytic murein transglycosylase n=1 Tax=Primorskyibacter sp. S87 TaxID=3415126 RepID=UPI003C7A07F3
MRILVTAAVMSLSAAYPGLASERSSEPYHVKQATSDKVPNSPELLLASAVSHSIRPAARPIKKAMPLKPERVALSNARFENWVRAFRVRAGEQGISTRTLDRAFHGLSYDPEVIKRDRNQAEFSKPIWAYLDSAVSQTRIRNGQAALVDHSAVLEQIERRYGVEREVLLAIWGLESSFGTYRGADNVIRSLSTLAFDSRRGRFFEGQLIAALSILDAGDVTPNAMTGSWAGAMGHTQFMPTSYLDYAVDFTGDGKRDIWSDDPTDALASTAAYLSRFGWTSGQPWGVEVRLPDGFDYALAQREITKDSADWAELGVLRVDGNQVADHGLASVLLPAGSKGAAFLIYENFSVLEKYNAADAYVIGVGHLADRIRGEPGFLTDWPRDDRSLNFPERKELQRRLTEQGFDTQGIDGRVGPNTIRAVRAFQVANGFVPDGYPSLALLENLR